jgi:hypothetical protein
LEWKPVVEKGRTALEILACFFGERRFHTVRKNWRCTFGLPRNFCAWTSSYSVRLRP